MVKCCNGNCDKWQNRHYRRGSANYRNTSVGNDANHSNENYTTNVEKTFNMIQSNALK